MSYPSHLLPKPDYQVIEWHDLLRLCYLIRSTSTPNVLDADTGKVRAKFVNDGSREQLKDYSNNLLGLVRSFLIEKAILNTPDPSEQPIAESWYKAPTT